MVDETDEKGWRHEGKRIEDEIEIRADPRAVWAAWADPEELARWFVDQAGGTAEPGGEMTWAWEAYGIEQSLKVLEAEAGERLVLEVTWGQGTPTILEVTLHPADGGTRVRLVHSGFLDEGSWDGEYEGARSGWANALAHLKLYLEEHAGRDKTTFDAVQPATYAPEDVLALTRTPDGLSRWFGHARAPLRSLGDAVRIELTHGGQLTGQVISLTDWETTITWEELDGALTFQAFPGEEDIEHGQRMVGLRTTSWGPGDPLEAHRKHLEAALDRLLQAIEAFGQG